MAIESNAELVLVHVWHIPPSAFPGEYDLPGDMIQAMVDDSKQRLDAAVRDASLAGAKRVTGTLLTGVPWAEIVEGLEKEGCDLCVMGTHGRSGLPRILLGSVAEKVVRHSPCSVLVVRPDSDVQPFAHALVPTDLSASANDALELAAGLVRPDGALTLLHVLELPVPFSGALPAELACDVDGHAAAALGKAAARLAPRVRTRTCTRMGYAGVQILATLDEDRSLDLVVMGSHGRTGIKRALIGSVAEKIVRHARCPVLVARKQA